MQRTTVLLPERLKKKANAKANILGLSLDEFIQLSIKNSINSQFNKKKSDPFIKDNSVFNECNANDCSINHNDYIY
jgi:hypothetical protein